LWPQKGKELSNLVPRRRPRRRRGRSCLDVFSNVFIPGQYNGNEYEHSLEREPNDVDNVGYTLWHGVCIMSANAFMLSMQIHIPEESYTNSPRLTINNIKLWSTNSRHRIFRTVKKELGAMRKAFGAEQTPATRSQVIA
jgi:hypothetical protein